MLEIIAQRTRVCLAQHRRKLCVTAEILSEIFPILAPQRPHKRIASFTPDLSISIATPIIEPVIAIVVTHASSKNYEHPLVLPQLIHL